jgi:hypothetical protein
MGTTDMAEMRDTADASDDPLRRKLRHDLRGELNALALCAEAAAGATGDAERLEWLSDVEAIADRVIALIDQLEQIPPDPRAV